MKNSFIQFIRILFTPKICDSIEIFIVSERIFRDFYLNLYPNSEIHSYDNKNQRIKRGNQRAESFFC